MPDAPQSSTDGTIVTGRPLSQLKSAVRRMSHTSLRLSRSSIIALAAFLCVYVPPATAQHTQVGPPAPFTDSGACPFEGCVYRAWKALRTVTARRAPSAGAAVAFHVAAGTTVTALTGLVVTTVPGQVRFRDTVTLVADGATLHIAPVDTLFLFTYEGEGFTTAWFKGRLYRGVDAGETIFNAACDTRPSVCLGRIVVRGRHSWWVKVCDAAGRVGWIDAPDAFAGKDADGESEPGDSLTQSAPSHDRCN